MPYDEFVGWQAFYLLEPWGCHVEDQRVAMALDMQYSIHSKPNSKPPMWFDRDPKSRMRPDPTPEELSEKVRDFFMGKTVKAASPEKKARKPRKDKGIKRKPNNRNPPTK